MDETSIEHHILFAFVSLVNARTIEHPVHYADLAGAPYDAVQTNESAIVCKARELQKAGHALERVFLLVSSDAKTKMAPPNEFGDAVTHADFLERRLVRERPELGGRIERIDYPDDAAALERNMLRLADIADTVRDYMKETRQGAKDETYIVHADMTGGYRHASVMMISILQMLSYDHVQQGDVLYSDPGDGTDAHPARVYQATPMLQVTKLLSGMDEFVNYGSVEALEEYFSTRAGSYSDELGALIEAMHTFSDAIRVCATRQILGTVKTLGERLQAFQAVPDKCIEEQLFDKCTDVLRENYGPLLKSDVSRLDIIEWCGAHQFWQQQMTLSTEWLPEYLVDHQICYTDLSEVIDDCAEEGPSMSRSWKQDFIITYHSHKNSLHATADPRKVFLSRFRSAIAEKTPFFPLQEEAQQRGWDTVAGFFKEYAHAKNAYQACRDGVSSWSSFLQAHPYFSHVMHILYDFWCKNPIYHKTFPDCLQGLRYAKIPSSFAALPDVDWMTKIFPPLPETAQEAQPLLSIDEKHRLMEGSKGKWRNRLEGYLQEWQTGEMKSRLPLKELIPILHSYFEIRARRNQVNHANPNEALDPQRFSDTIRDYLDTLRHLEKGISA